LGNDPSSPEDHVDSDMLYVTVAREGHRNEPQSPTDSSLSGGSNGHPLQLSPDDQEDAVVEEDPGDEPMDDDSSSDVYE
jgi:hypothetical protein